jgi:hypothetical protein
MFCDSVTVVRSLGRVALEESSWTLFALTSLLDLVNGALTTAMPPRNL